MKVGEHLLKYEWLEAMPSSPSGRGVIQESVTRAGGGRRPAKHASSPFSQGADAASSDAASSSFPLSAGGRLPRSEAAEGGGGGARSGRIAKITAPHASHVPISTYSAVS